MNATEFLQAVSELVEEGQEFSIFDGEICPNPVDLVYGLRTGRFEDDPDCIAARLVALGLGWDDRDALVEASLLEAADCDFPAMRYRMLRACGLDN
ncbi:MAG: hypothetical protein KDA42_12355 [Planctomycetales bacterium]|nr:hypothetical protein [Planctomycetales bacterium]